MILQLISKGTGKENEVELYGERFERHCEEMLAYLYELAYGKYGSSSDIDGLVQDAIIAYIVKLRKGEAVEHPKAFLAACVKNLHNMQLRRKYKSDHVSFEDACGAIGEDPYEEIAEKESLSAEYEAVRREIGRLMEIYRSVTVKYYVHGKTVDTIAAELNVPRGTVLSRLSFAREQIKERITDMEKYSSISFEPKKATIGIWGYGGMHGEPFSLIHSDIESNILALAYENPVSVRAIADTMGMPTVFIEQAVESLVNGELMGRTERGLVYTRCFVCHYSDSFGNISLQESLAKENAQKIWDAAEKLLSPLIDRPQFAEMTEKQKGTMVLFVLLQALISSIHNASPVTHDNSALPERPNGGKWYATVTLSEYDEKRDSKYMSSGPVHVGYGKNYTMYDFQSVFGDAHWAYGKMKYTVNVRQALSLYAYLHCGKEKPESTVLPELIPEFEKLFIIRKDESGKACLDVPVLSFGEYNGYWRPAIKKLTKELDGMIGEKLKEIWLATKNRVPKHVDGREHFLHDGALGAYIVAQLLEITEQGLLPYRITVGKTPIIMVAYRDI